MSQAMIMSRLGLANIRWQRAWCIAICVWLVGCILITGYRFPTEARLRAAWAAASYQTLIRDRQTIDAADAECEKLATDAHYSASLICADDVLHMTYAYQDRLSGLVAYGEMLAQEERLPDQFFVVAGGIALWAVPSFGLYLIGFAIEKLKSRAEN